MLAAGGAHGAFQFLDEALEIGVHLDEAHIVRRIEAAMDLRDRRDAALCFRQSIPGDGIAAECPLLHGDEGGDELQAVGDAVVDLAKQHLRPLARLAHLPLRGFLLPPQPRGRKGLLGRRAEKIEKDPADILDHVIGGSRLESGDGDPPFIGAR